MKSISKLKDEARRYEQREEWEKAINAYLQVIRIGDEAGEGDVELPLFNRIGDLCVRLGRPGDAVRYYEEAADRYADAGLYNNAIALCNKALRYQPDHLELMRKLGQFSASQGFLTDARRHFLEYAERKFKGGEVDAALSALADFAGVVDDGEIRELLGRRLHAYGRNEQAVRELQTAYAMYVHTGEQDRAEAVRATLLGIDPNVSLEAPPPEPAADPFDAAAQRHDDLPRFEPLGVQHGAAIAPPPEERPEAPPLEGLMPTAHEAEEPVVDLPFLDVEPGAADAGGDGDAHAPVAGLESTNVEFDAATHDLTELDLGPGLERDETSFDAVADDADFLIQPGEPLRATGIDWLDDEDDAGSTDEPPPADLPLLHDPDAEGYDLPLLEGTESFDEAPLPLLDDGTGTDDEDAPLPLLDDGSEYAAPLPLLEDPGAEPEVTAETDPTFAAAYEPPAEDAFVDDAAGDAGDDEDLPVWTAEPAARTEPVLHDEPDRDYDLASFEDDPPAFRMPELDGTPPPVPLDMPSLELPRLELPEFDLQGIGSAEPLLFEVEEPGAQADEAEPPIFRPEDLTPYAQSGFGDFGEPAGSGADTALPEWAESEYADAPGDEFEQPQPDGFTGVELPEDWSPDALGDDDLPESLLFGERPDAERAEEAVEESGAGVDAIGEPLPDWLEPPFDVAGPEVSRPEPAPDPFAALPEPSEDAPAAIPDALHDSLDDRPAVLDELPGMLEELPGALDELPGALDELPGMLDELSDVLDDGPGADDAAAVLDEPFMPSGRGDALDALDEPPVFDAPTLDDAAPDEVTLGEAAPDEPWGAAGDAAAELPLPGGVVDWADGGVDIIDAEAELERGADALEELRASAPWGGEVPTAEAEPAAEEPAAAAAAEEWTPHHLLEPEAQPRPAAPPPPPPPVTEDDDEFVDLGALLRGEEEPASTRFYVQEKPPTGDEDRDFAELLSQFKAKISEHVPAEDAAAHYDLALAYKEMGLVDEAIAEFQIALRAGRMRLKIYEELGECFLQKRQFNIAEKVLSRALATNYEDELELLGVYYHLGRAYEEMGRTEQARDAYERVLGMDIAFQDVAERLARL